jgi:methionyl-tRNA formyltransferase
MRNRQSLEKSLTFIKLFLLISVTLLPTATMLSATKSITHRGLQSIFSCTTIVPSEQRHITSRNLLRGSPAQCIQSGVLRSSTRLFSSTSSSGDNQPKKVIFLGTPDVAATSLELIYGSSAKSSDNKLYDVIAVVSQPPAPSGRNKKLTPSPVHLLAEKLQIQLFTPETAKDPEFLSALEGLAPDLCITAAYGQYLPKRFLAIPKCGTVNIHPSLLPKYRGAAPVQRCLENGDAESGVTVLYTVSKMDAGPIIAQHTLKLTGDEKAPEFLDAMFKKGSQMLIEAMPAILDGKVEQDESQATAANKLSPSDARTDFSELTALQVHNKARGLALWPGLWSTFKIATDTIEGGAIDWSSLEAQRVKIITTTVLDASANSAQAGDRTVSVVKQGKKDILRIVCKDGSVLGITELQPPGKKVMDVRSWVNGFRGSYAIKWEIPPLQEAAAA